MLQKIIENFKFKMHTQFKEIQKWQREMYNFNSNHENEIH